MRYYIDSAPIIYLVEQVQPYASSVRNRLINSESTLITSELTRLECRTKPIRDGDMELLKDFDDYFARYISDIFPLSRDVINQATIIRARFNFKTPDAIHLVAALSSNCDIFFTNDLRPNKFTDIAIEIV